MSVADKFRTMADKLQSEIDKKRATRNENTPKRQREAKSARIDADHLERGQKAMRLLADLHEQGVVPELLRGLSTKVDVLKMVRTRTGSNSYYDVHDTHEFADTSPAAKVLQDLIGNVKSPEQQAIDKRRDVEAKLKFCDIPGFFPTPRPVIDMMLEQVDIGPDTVCLEPSAGKGDIADAIVEAGGSVLCVEVNHTLADLVSQRHETLCDDFLTLKPEGDPQFDAVVMNPPFEKSQDVQHVRHAYSFVKPGGRVVAIVAASSVHCSQIGKRREFSEWLKEQDHEVIDIPDGSFASATSFRQTGVAVKLVVINKPHVREESDVEETNNLPAECSTGH